MGTREKREREFSLIDLLWDILFSWRQVLCLGIIFAILVSGLKYARDIRAFNVAQSANIGEEEIKLTAEEEQKIENARIMMERIDNYQDYLETSALMQINPYKKPVVELQYYVESEYTYNYTKDNQPDYTGNLVSLYNNYIKSGEMSKKVIESAGLSINQADFSELCKVVQVGTAIEIEIAWGEEEKLDVISKVIKSELSKKEADFQKIGPHKLNLIMESKNVIADTDLADKRSLAINSIATIIVQLNNLKLNMTEQQLKLLGAEQEVNNKTEDIVKPGFNYKYLILGGFFGVFLVCSWRCFKKIFTVKLQNSEDICNLYNVRLIVEVVVSQKKKPFMPFIDDKLLELKNRRKKKLSLEQQIKMISANITLSCRQQKIDYIFITGSEFESVDTTVLAMLKRELSDQGIQVREGGNIFYDVESLKQGTEIGNILFIEQKGKSIYDEISNELNLANEQKNNILGFVILS